MKGIESVYPLSPMQEGILYHSLVEPDAEVYLNQLAWRITVADGAPALDPETFRRAWALLVDRYAALRTSLVWDKVERPIQVVHRDVEPPFRHLDLRDEPEERRWRRLEEDDLEIRARGFDLSRAPLFAVRLARLEDRVYHFQLSFQHIVLDGWSVFLLLREVMVCYAALAAGREPPPADRRPFRDYIVWLDKLDLAEAEEFWRRELAGVTRATPLEVDGTGEDVPPGEPRIGLARRELSAEDTARLRAFARAKRVTDFTLLQAAWALVLSRYSGHDRVVFGSVTLGRPAELEGADRIIGLFVNTLPVVAEYGPDEPVGEWLRSFQARCLEARKYEACPLPRIREWAGFGAGVPLFRTLALSSSYVGHSKAGGGGEVETDELPLSIEFLASRERTNYPLVVEGTGSGRLALVSRFDRGCLGAATVERMLGHLETVLLSLPDAESPRQVSLLSEAERRELVAGPAVAPALPSDGPSADPPGDTVPELFAARAGRHPDAVALVGGRAALTYGETHRRVRALARLLLAAGAGGESCVAVALERSPWVPIAWLAVLEAGSAYLPVDPDQPPERLRRVFDSAAPAAIILEGKTLAAWPAELAGAAPPIIVPLDSDVAGDEPSEAGPLGRARPRPESLAHVIFTSGSTGTPKGSMNSHRAVVDRFRARVEGHGTGRDERFLQVLGTTFDPSILEMAQPLLAGACLVVAPAGMTREPAALGREIARRAVGAVTFVPSLLRTLLEHADPDDLQGLSDVIVGGEVFDRALLLRFRALLPEARVGNHYGPTEATVEVTRWMDDGGPVQGEGPPIGRPVPGAAVVVVDRELRPVPVGVPGEIVVGGPGIARGYVGRPGETAERFVPDPFAPEGDPVRSPGGRLYRTGDLARRRPSGELDFLGRIDRQVKIRGFRIELGDVEAAARSHEAVRDAVAVVRPTADGTGTIVVYLVGGDGDDAGEALRRALDARFGERLPHYMRPSAQVWLDELPRLPSGKVDRRDLARRRPEPEAGEVIAPRDDTERRLVEIWQAVLGREPVSVDGDFFELGGHSLLAIRLVAKINYELDASVPISALLTGGPATPERLAREVRGRSEPLGWEPLVRMKEGDRPPFFCVHPVGGQVFGFRELAAAMAPGQPFYGLRAPGLEEHEAEGGEAVTIERMAAHYVEAVREELPEGPYFVGGVSFGVTVAFEMARQLRRAGAPVGLVALFDSPVPVDLESVEGEDYSEILAAASREYAHQMGGSIDFDLADLTGRDRDEQTAHVLGLLRQGELVSEEVEVAMMRRMIDGHQARLTALARYRPEPYHGTLHLFHATRRHREIVSDLPAALRRPLDDPELGWGPYATEGVVVHEIDAYHETLLRPPAVRRVAARLQELIDAASRPAANPEPSEVLTAEGDPA